MPRHPKREGEFEWSLEITAFIAVLPAGATQASLIAPSVPHEGAGRKFFCTSNNARFRCQKAQAAVSYLDFSLIGG